MRVDTPVPASSGRPNVSLEGCFFRGGHEAILLTRSAAVAADNCAFGPHAALFCFRGPKVHERDTEITLSHCSAMLRGDEAAFHLDAGGSCRLSVNHCLFSCPLGASEVEGDGAVLVRQTGEPLGDLRFEGLAHNVYHNITDFWVLESRRGVSHLALTLADFLKQTKANRSDRWLDLADQPLAGRTGRWRCSTSSRSKRFRSIPKYRSCARRRNSPGPSASNVLSGASFWTSPCRRWRTGPPSRWSARPRSSTRGWRKSARGLYPTLRQALGDARAGDTILIRHTGPMAVEPVLSGEADRRCDHSARRQASAGTHPGRDQ